MFEILNKFKISRTILFSLLVISVFTTKSNINVFLNKDAVIFDIKNQLTDISKDWSLIGSLFPSFTQNDAGKVTTAYYSFDNIEITSAVFMPENINNLEIDEFSSNSEVITEGGRAFEATIAFSYKYKHTSFSDEGKGHFTIFSNNFLFKKEYGTTGDVEGTLQLTIFTDKVSIDSGKYKDDAKIRDFMTMSFTQYVAMNVQPEILNKIDTKVSEYYSQFTQIPLDVNTPTTDKLVNISGRNFILPFNQQQGITYYVNGQVIDSSNNSINNLKYLQNNSNKNNFKFDPKDGAVQFFVDLKLFEDVFSHLTKDNNFQYILNNTNFPKSLQFDLDIGDLGQVYPGIIIKLFNIVYFY